MRNLMMMTIKTMKIHKKTNKRTMKVVHQKKDRVRRKRRTRIGKRSEEMFDKKKEQVRNNENRP